jgi:hypothetical protein
MFLVTSDTYVTSIRLARKAEDKHKLLAAPHRGLIVLFSPIRRLRKKEA